MIFGIAIAAIAAKTVGESAIKKIESKLNTQDNGQSSGKGYYSPQNNQNCQQGYYDTRKSKHSFFEQSIQNCNQQMNNSKDTKLYISMRRDSKDYIKEDCFDVECELKAMGFKKINLVPRKDLVSESDPYMNQVFAIEVDGVSYFYKNQKCDKDSNIIVFYHVAKSNTGKRVDLFVKSNSEDNNESSNKTCSSCGGVLKFGTAKFCPYCGGKL